MPDETLLDEPLIEESPEEAALRADLAQYDNPEAFGDLSYPQIYNFRISSTYFSDYPTVLSVSLHGDDLPDVLVRSFMDGLQRDPLLDETLANAGVETFQELEDEIYADPQTAKDAQRMTLFFARHFPQVMLHVYSMMCAASAMSVVEVDKDSAEVRELARNAFERRLANLRLFLLNALGVRTTPGADKKPEPVAVVSDTVQRVREAIGFLSDGKAMPKWEAIALHLEMKNRKGGFLDGDALRKRVEREGYRLEDFKLNLHLQADISADNN